MRRVVLLGLTLLPGLAGADEVFIRGGGQLRGEIVEQGPDSILVDIGTGRIGLPLSAVEKVVPGETPLAAYRERAAALAPEDAAGWLALGEWARDQDLEVQARRAFENVLAADPADAAAHRALGHVQVDGAWMTHEDGQRARGYVFFEGAWVTADERQAILEDRRAAAEERGAWAESEARIWEAQARAREADARARLAEVDVARAEFDLRRAEDEARQAWPGFTVGAWTPWYSGAVSAPIGSSLLAYPAAPPVGYSYPMWGRRAYTGYAGYRPVVTPYRFASPMRRGAFVPRPAPRIAAPRTAPPLPAAARAVPRRGR
jgi:hypothetical protein